MNTTNPYAMHERFKDRIHNPQRLKWEDFGDPTIWRPALKDEATDVPHQRLEGENREWRNTIQALDCFREFGGTYRIRLTDRPWPEVPAEQSFSPWIACAGRKPTKEDANEDGEVLWRFKRAGACAAIWDDESCALESSHWMSIPFLPEAPEVEAAEEWVPLEPEDFPGKLVWLRLIGTQDNGALVLSYGKDGVWCGDIDYTFETLATDTERSFDGQEWMPCRKLKRKEPV